jgi:hypothetical protein
MTRHNDVFRLSPPYGHPYISELTAKSEYVSPSYGHPYISELTAKSEYIQAILQPIYQTHQYWRGVYFIIRR